MEDPKLKIKGAVERSSSLRDEELIALFLQGERSRFRELVERYDQKLLNFINRLIGDRERSEDLVQETFIRVYKHLDRFDQDKKFSTWVYTIAGNLAKNELRNRARNPIVLLENLIQEWDEDHRSLEFADNSKKPDDLFMKRHLREVVEKAVEKLPTHHRLVFVLREAEGKSYEEIAEITGCSLGTVKSRLNRARNNFAAIVAPMLDMEAPPVKENEEEGNRREREG